MNTLSIHKKNSPIPRKYRKIFSCHSLFRVSKLPFLHVAETLKSSLFKIILVVVGKKNMNNYINKKKLVKFTIDN